MIKCTEKNTKYKYKLYQSSFVQGDLEQFKYDSKLAFANYNRLFGKNNTNSTWGYNLYNIFQISAGSLCFYKIFVELREAIFDFIDDDMQDPIWFQSWLNYHKSNEVLD